MVLGFVSAMAIESGFLGPFDSETAALNVTLTTYFERKNKWGLVFGKENLEAVAGIARERKA